MEKNVKCINCQHFYVQNVRKSFESWCDFNKSYLFYLINSFVYFSLRIHSEEAV